MHVNIADLEFSKTKEVCHGGLEYRHRQPGEQRPRLRISPKHLDGVYPAVQVNPLQHF